MTANLTTPPVELGVSESSSVNISTHNPTTKFADDTIGEESTPIFTTDTFITGLVADSSQTIVDFLRRPTVMSYGSFTASDAGLLYIRDAADLLSAQKKQRLSNIFTIKFDIEVTLQVNADRFQQGRYILAWLPTGGGSGLDFTVDSANTLWRNMHTANLTTITQLPHVEIDLATQTHVTLKIPYTSIIPMFTYSTAIAQMTTGLGPVLLIPYSKLNPGTGGSTTCGYTIWASCQNVTIGSASVNQSAAVNEARALNVGPISGTLDKISKTAKIVGEVPVFGPLMSTTSWAAALAARAARIWGFSKPLNLSAPQRMDRKISAFNAVSDVASTAKPLAVLSEHSVAAPPSIPKNVDEMSIDYIKKIYAYTDTTNWTSSSTAGTLLYSVLVSPNVYTTWSKGRCYTPVSFVGQQFDRWRGTIKYRFKLVKTAFHRGRLLVAFIPGTTPAASVTLQDTEMVFREVVDISTTSEFEVCCPYMLPRAWQQNTDISGTLVLYVVDPLVAPTTVSSSVQILVEQAGGDDFQVAVPIPWGYEPYAPSTAQMAESYTTTPCFELGPKSNNVSDTVPLYTIGETVKSIRQLIKRMWSYDYQTLIGGDSYITIAPYVMEPVTQLAGTGGTLQRTAYYSDYVNLWAHAFAQNYGSMRYMIDQNNSTLQSSTMVMATTATSVVSSLVYSATRPTFFGFATANSSVIEGPIEFQSPVWTTNYGRSACTQIASAARGIIVGEAFGSTETVTLYGDRAGYSQPQSSISFNRAAGEDFGFGVFVGVPPVVARGTT